MDFEEKSLVGEIRQVPENSVGGKYGRSEEASFVFFVPSCLEFISNEHTCRVSSLEMIQRNCLCIYASVEIAASAAANVVRQESEPERIHLIKLIR